MRRAIRIEGVAEHAFPLKWIPDATALRHHLLRQFECVEAQELERSALTFVVAGGGPTGVELSGAIAELIERVMRHDHPHIDLSRPVSCWPR